jgi:hypothetical protein
MMVDFLYSVPPILMAVGITIFGSQQRVTATMIDFYTNKRVCIVHKGEIKGRMFICSKCDAFYCVKCKEAIETIDKCCWNCKAPFGQSAEAGAATLSQVDPSIDAPGMVISKGEKSSIGKEPGKVPLKGAVAGIETIKAPNKVPGKE